MQFIGQLALRGTVLFAIGTTFSLVLSLLQLKRQWSSFQSGELITEIISTNWWLPLTFGVGSVVVGLLYPWFECPSSNQVQEWSKVLRCSAMFIGINEACTKIEFPSNWQLTLSLAILSVGLWWYFDRTPLGLVMGISISFLTIIITQLLVYHKVFMYSEREFLYMRSWLPCVVFSGGITIGNIGKQLAVNDFIESPSKKHIE